MIASLNRFEQPFVLNRTDLSAFACQNIRCADRGKRGAGNLSVDSWYGKRRQYRILKCRTCRVRFSERKGTRMFGSQLSEDQVVLLLGHLAEGRSVRETAKLLNLNRNTVVRYGRLCAKAHSEKK